MITKQVYYFEREWAQYVTCLPSWFWTNWERSRREWRAEEKLSLLLPIKAKLGRWWTGTPDRLINWVPLLGQGSLFHGISTPKLTTTYTLFGGGGVLLNGTAWDPWTGETICDALLYFHVLNKTTILLPRYSSTFLLACPKYGWGSRHTSLLSQYFKLYFILKFWARDK